MNLRNKLCICGSGIKTKNCCGNEVKKALERQEARKPLPYIPPILSNTATPEEKEMMNRRERPRGGMSMLGTMMLVAAAMSQGNFPLDKHKKF